MTDARARVVIRGRVQGVFFRVETRERARSLGLAGWVRNNPDGTVEAVFQGDRDRVDSMLAWCRRGPAAATSRTSRSSGRNRATSAGSRLAEPGTLVSVEPLLQRPVSLHGVRVGHVVDVILEAAEGRPMGLEVRCLDGRHRFLPMAAATPAGAEVVIDSPLRCSRRTSSSSTGARRLAARRPRSAA